MREVFATTEAFQHVSCLPAEELREPGRNSRKEENSLSRFAWSLYLYPVHTHSLSIFLGPALGIYVWFIDLQDMMVHGGENFGKGKNKEHVWLEPVMIPPAQGTA